MQRIYVLDLDKHVESTEARTLDAELVVLGDYGVCEPVRSDTPILRAKPSGDALTIQAAIGFVCKVDQSEAVFVATFSSATNSKLRTRLVNTKTKRYKTMDNAMPTT